MPKLNVGDRVKIVNVRNCKFDYNPSMLKLTGRTTVITCITDESSDDYMGEIEYKVKIDRGVYIWSANCLEPIKHKFIIKNE